MIVRLRQGLEEHEITGVRERFTREGLRTYRSDGSSRACLAVVDPVDDELRERTANDPRVSDLRFPKGAARLVAAEFREAPTVVPVGDARIGGDRPVVIAGPCSVEGADLAMEAAEYAAAGGADILRGGAYKPRTSPYAFRGLGAEGLRQLKCAGDAVGLPVVSEVMDARHLPAFAEHGIDCLQIGARNMQNFTLLESVATLGRPVLLKRGLSATVEEWLLAAEYLLAHGAEHVVLCERGIRTFETATRNTLDLTVLPLLKQRTHLPVIVDPSHAAGKPELIGALSRAAIAAGADGLALEIHPRPHQARSDGAQALLPGELARTTANCRALAAALKALG